MQIGEQSNPFTTAVPVKIQSSDSLLTAEVGLRKQTPTGNVLQVQIGPGDVISNIPVVTLFEHHQVHEGEAHDYEYYSATPATIDFAIVVPAYTPTIGAPHLLIGMQSYGGAGMLSLYEGATYTGGTPGVIFNRNRNSLIVPKVGFSIQEGVTIVGAGTKLPYTIILGAAEKTSELNRALNEVVLKENTIYALRYEEITATTRLIITLNWYEDLGV